MAKAQTDTYATHSADVDKLMVDIDKAYEYVNGAPQQGLAAKQWDVLRKDIITSFMTLWKSSNQTLDRDYVSAMVDNSNQAYDQIICLEVNKEKQTSCAPRTDLTAATTPTSTTSTPASRS